MKNNKPKTTYKTGDFITWSEETDRWNILYGQIVEKENDFHYLVQDEAGEMFFVELFEIHGKISSK